MKRLLWLWLLTLPLHAEPQALRSDAVGCLSFTYRVQGEGNFLALEGRNQGSDSWHTLGHWDLKDAQTAHFETGPTMLNLEYRLVILGPAGFLFVQPIQLDSGAG
jgi:hypothetical protein